jgi:hypothetical protein
MEVTKLKYWESDESATLSFFFSGWLHIMQPLGYGFDGVQGHVVDIVQPKVYVWDVPQRHGCVLGILQR